MGCDRDASEYETSTTERLGSEARGKKGFVNTLNLVLVGGVLVFGREACKRNLRKGKWKVGTWMGRVWTVVGG